MVWRQTEAHEDLLVQFLTVIHHIPIFTVTNWQLLISWYYLLANIQKRKAHRWVLLSRQRTAIHSVKHPTLFWRKWITQVQSRERYTHKYSYADTQKCINLHTCSWMIELMRWACYVGPQESKVYGTQSHALLQRLVATPTQASKDGNTAALTIQKVNRRRFPSHHRQQLLFCYLIIFF